MHTWKYPPPPGLFRREHAPGAYPIIESNNWSRVWKKNPGGGGVLRCCLDGGARLKPPNPYPSLRVIFGGKGYIPIIRGLAEKGTHYLGIFSQENDVFVYFSDKMGEITNPLGGMFREIFPRLKTGTHV